MPTSELFTTVQHESDSRSRKRSHHIPELVTVRAGRVEAAGSSALPDTCHSPALGISRPLLGFLNFA